MKYFALPALPISGCAIAGSDGALIRAFESAESAIKNVSADVSFNLHMLEVGGHVIKLTALYIYIILPALLVVGFIWYVRKAHFLVSYYKLITILLVSAYHTSIYIMTGDLVRAAKWVAHKGIGIDLSYDAGINIIIFELAISMLLFLLCLSPAGTNFAIDKSSRRQYRIDLGDDDD